MLVKSESKNRTFDVIGYKEFEMMFESDDVENQKWVSRLGKLFDGVVIKDANANDMRIKQLENTYKSIAKLILTIKNSEIETGLLSEATISSAAVVEKNA
ncbi:hypothetical protein OWD07_22830 [Vibrio diabolicus]|nr:hypothetical protein [Vibrio diabolicus]MCZ0743313.1 hypothetical protein [Vibrio diabolicus]